jgi:two-component system NtrC family sensor kinase
MKYLLLSLCLLTCPFCFGQSKQLDSLKLELTHATSDTMRVLIYEKLINAIPDTTAYNKTKIEFGRQGFNLAKRIGYNKGIVRCGNQLGQALAHQEYYKAIPILMEAKRAAEISNDKEGLAFALYCLGYAYSKFDSEKGLSYYFQVKSFVEKEGLSENVMPNMTIGLNYISNKNKLDSALFYINKSYQHACISKTYSYRPIQHLRHFGRVYYEMGKLDIAMNYLRQAIASTAYREEPGFCDRYMAFIFRDKNQLDSAKIYAEKSLKAMQIAKTNFQLVETLTLLCELYKNENPAKSLQYLLLANAARDSLFSKDKIKQLNNLAYEEQEREAGIKRRMEARQTEFENKIKIYVLLGVLAGLSILAFLLYRNNKNKHKANQLLHRQKQEIDLQRNKAEKALTELKSTQAQLIQKEKLASLGELTAGIAHEIQNPLNFVNNFSELSVELAKELKGERSKVKEDRDEELENELVDDLIQNQEKINHHGKRASSIVKGMLEHSRLTTGERQLTDINQLADEYLRLAYHGFRAKVSNFECELMTDFDPNLPKVEVVPQEIGRVLLNLINNGFYAVQEQGKRKTEHGISAYKPTLTLRTKAEKGQLIIYVKDNGGGISDTLKDKIFQPFFTTKPTGEGTGLGLSLAYDIVTKGHGGTLEVETKEGEGTTFIVKLPIQTT